MNNVQLIAMNASNEECKLTTWTCPVWHSSRDICRCWVHVYTSPPTHSIPHTDSTVCSPSLMTLLSGFYLPCHTT